MGELTTQNAVEVFGAGDPDIRTTQNAVEVLGSSTPDIRTTQNAVEVLGSSNPDIRVTQIAVEVIGPVEAPPPLPAPPTFKTIRACNCPAYV